jgi:thiamine-phosphate pyrophosphorylase
MLTDSARPISGLYAITPANLELAEMLARVKCALTGGARLIQLRAKNWPRDQVEGAAQTLRAMTQRHDALLIINDDASLARAVQADGVHFGRSDATWDTVKAIAKEKMLVGVSCYNDLDRAQMAQTAGASYVAFGSMFPSKTKPDAAQASLDLLRTARAALTVPIVAIGGILPGNAARVVEAGADAVAVISGLFDAPDVEAAAQSYVRACHFTSAISESTA